MRNGYLLSLVFIVFLAGCAQPSDRASLEVEDISFIQQSEGPVAVRIVASVIVTGSCKLSYDNNLVDVGDSVAGKETVTLVSQLEGRLDLGKWGICCDTTALEKFNSIGKSTVCKGREA